MQIIDIRDAETKLLELIDDVKQGQEFVLIDQGVPVARLVSAQLTTIERKSGAMSGKIRIAEDFDAPLDNDVISTFDGRS